MFGEGAFSSSSKRTSTGRGVSRGKKPPTRAKGHSPKPPPPTNTSLLDLDNTSSATNSEYEQKEGDLLCDLDPGTATVETPQSVDDLLGGLQINQVFYIFEILY